MRSLEEYDRDKRADDELCRWEERVMDTVKIDRELLEELIGAFASETDRLRSRRQDKCMKAGIKIRDALLSRVKEAIAPLDQADQR